MKHNYQGRHQGQARTKRPVTDAQIHADAKRTMRNRRPGWGTLLVYTATCDGCGAVLDTLVMTSGKRQEDIDLFTAHHQTTPRPSYGDTKSSVTVTAANRLPAAIPPASPCLCRKNHFMAQLAKSTLRIAHRDLTYHNADNDHDDLEAICEVVDLAQSTQDEITAILDQIHTDRRHLIDLFHINPDMAERWLSDHCLGVWRYATKIRRMFPKVPAVTVTAYNPATNYRQDA